MRVELTKAGGTYVMKAEAGSQIRQVGRTQIPSPKRYISKALTQVQYSH